MPSRVISDQSTSSCSLPSGMFLVGVSAGWYLPHPRCSDTFSSLQPTYFPGFAFSWMSLISHRLFMPKLLLSENREVILLFLDIFSRRLNVHYLGMVGLLQTLTLAIQVPLSLPQVCRIAAIVPRPLSRVAEIASCTSPRLSRVPQRVLLQPLRYDPASLHPTSQHRP